MTAPLIVAVVLALVAGLASGWLLRGWWDRMGHDRLMRRKPQTTAGLDQETVSARTRTLLVAVVVVAVLCNAAVGFLLLDSRRREAAGAAMERARTLCNTEYNRLDGLARDERAAQADKQRTAARVLFVQLRSDLRKGRLTNDVLDDRITEYVDELDKTVTKNAKNPYPPADFCSAENIAKRGVLR